MKILFEGDSSSDGGHDRSCPQDLGELFPKYVSAMIEDSFREEEFEFMNLSETDQTIQSLTSRMEAILAEYGPDILVLSIGQDEIRRVFANGEAMPDDEFETKFRALLAAVQKDSRTKVLLIEPFYFPHSLEADKKLKKLFASKQAIVRSIAPEYTDAFIPLQQSIDTWEKPSSQAELDFDDPISEDGFTPSEDYSVLISEQVLTALTPLIESESQS